LDEESNKNDLSKAILFADFLGLGWLEQYGLRT
jgi:hypothetical protein